MRVALFLALLTIAIASAAASPQVCANSLSQSCLISLMQLQLRGNAATLDFAASRTFEASELHRQWDLDIAAARHGDPPSPIISKPQQVVPAPNLPQEVQAELQLSNNCLALHYSAAMGRLFMGWRSAPSVCVCLL